MSLEKNTDKPVLKLDIVEPHEDYKKIYAIIENFVKDNGELTSVNITLCITKIMIFVQRISELSGDQKKELVLYAINDYISTIENIQLKTQLILFYEFIPSIIDTLIDVNNQKIIIKSVNKCCISIKKLFN